MDIYATCPTLETPRFLLRLVRETDAPDLFACYHDDAAVARMNADNCDFGFFADTPVQMAETVAYWLKHYAWRSFVRFAIVDKATGKAVGTVEGFGGETGVLRVDVVSSCETEAALCELLNFAADHFGAWFGNQRLVFKAFPKDTVRRAALTKCGWTEIGSFRDYPHYYRRVLP